MATAGDDSVHLARPEPARTGPRRTGLGTAQTQSPPPPPPSPAGDQPPSPAGDPPEVHEVIAEAVRIGYDVVNENLRQGRAAANAHSAGQYKLEHVPDDLSQLGGRLLQLSRDLGTTWFDLVGAILADPVIRDAVSHRQTPNRAPPQPQPAPHPAPNPAPSPAPTGPIALTCVFRGSRQATAPATTLAQPEAPSLLTMAALNPTDGNGPPITGISFTASNTGGAIGVVAIITIPDHQPAGTYHGVVADAATMTALGAVTVRVA